MILESVEHGNFKESSLIKMVVSWTFPYIQSTSGWLPSGNLTVCSWTWPSRNRNIVDLPSYKMLDLSKIIVDLPSYKMLDLSKIIVDLPSYKMLDLSKIIVDLPSYKMLDLSIVFGMFTRPGTFSIAVFRPCPGPWTPPRRPATCATEAKKKTALCGTAVEVKVEGPGVIAAVNHGNLMDVMVNG